MDLDAQVAAARSGALAVPGEGLGVLVVTGGDRQSWLNGLVTCDVGKLGSGQAAYGLAVERKGRILTDLVVLAAGEALFMVAPSKELGELRAELDRHLIMEDVEMSAGEFGVTFVHGPAAGAALEAARAAGAVGAPFDATGLGGAIVLSPNGARARIDETLAAHAVRGDDRGWDALRLERGVPRFGVDFDATMYPQEASIEKRAVSFDKGCYLGQEVVFMLEQRGHVKRRLVPVVISGGEAPAKGTGVTTAAGDAIGEVTSAATSPTLGTPVAIAMVKYAHAKAGAEVLVGGVPGRVVEVPA